MQKIIIFGSTGMTGLCALESAVKRGYQVTVFVRDETKIPSKYTGMLNVIVGNVTNEDQVEKAVAGQEGVVVVLGTRNDLKPTTELSEGLTNIIQSMKKHNVEVITVCLSAFLFWPIAKVPEKFRDLNADHQRMFDILKESNLKWIAVLPPHITDTPKCEYSIEYDKSPGRVISKYELAEFLVEGLEKPEHYQKVCGVATKPGLGCDDSKLLG